MKLSPRHGATLLRRVGQAGRQQHAASSAFTCCPPRASALAAQIRPASSTRSASADSSSNFSSVNAEEISHFNALALEWWNPHGSSRVLHLMNPLRHDFIRRCHASQMDGPPSPEQKLKYLDVGCGGGIFAESAARLSSTAHVTAIDPSPEVLNVARRHARTDPALSVGGKLEYRSATIETLPEPAKENDLYDVVALWEVVEHVDNPAAFLDRCGQFVRPGGWMVMSTIARTWMSWFTTNFVAEDVLGMVPKGTHDWDKYIQEEELRGHFATRPGWSHPRVMGVVYVPGLGWKEVSGSEKIGNYFFAIRKDLE